MWIRKKTDSGVCRGHRYDTCHILYLLAHTLNPKCCVLLPVQKVKHLDAQPTLMPTVRALKQAWTRTFVTVRTHAERPRSPSKHKQPKGGAAGAWGHLEGGSCQAAVVCCGVLVRAAGPAPAPESGGAVEV